MVDGDHLMVMKSVLQVSDQGRIKQEIPDVVQ